MRTLLDAWKSGKLGANEKLQVGNRGGVRISGLCYTHPCWVFRGPAGAIGWSEVGCA